MIHANFYGRVTERSLVFQIFRDVCCHREIMALKVYCRSENNGCSEQMSLQQIPVSTVHCESTDIRKTRTDLRG